MRVDNRKKINSKGLSLMVVVFMMLLLGILGWTLVSMLASDFQLNLRALDSERALYLAEAGREWALRMLLSNASWNTSSDADCNHANEWLLHNLSSGQYEVCARGNQSGENCSVVVESSGYVPTKANYLAMRKIKIFLNSGKFRNVLQTKGLFNWSQVNKTAGDSYFAGHMQCGHYNGDGDGIYDETGVDYRAAPNELPPDNNATNRDRLLASQPFPDINMDYYRQRASTIWPQNFVASEAKIANMHSGGGGQTDIRVDNDIFRGQESQWRNNIIRNVNSTVRSWRDQDWRIIDSVQETNEIRVSNASDWAVNDTIRIGQRFRGGQGGYWYDTILYVRGDAFIDVRNSTEGGGEDIRMRRTGIVVEGDTLIKGTHIINFTDRQFVWWGSEYPALGTENGNITSLNTPEGTTNNEKRLRRQFDNTIYSKNGTIEFNYIDGEAVIGSNITFYNSTRLTYDNNDSGISGFGWGVAKRDWVEQ